MSKKILQLNFKFSVSSTEYEQAVSPLAEDFAAVPGLIWKVWLMNEAESEAGGIYLFKDESTLKAYLEGPHYPEPHKWYAEVEMKDGVIVKVK